MAIEGVTKKQLLRVLDPDTNPPVTERKFDGMRRSAKGPIVCALDNGTQVIWRKNDGSVRYELVGTWTNVFNVLDRLRKGKKVALAKPEAP